MLIIISVCMYESMSLSNKAFKYHSCGGLISYVGEWHEEVLGYEESSGRVALIDLRG